MSGQGERAERQNQRKGETDRVPFKIDPRVAQSLLKFCYIASSVPFYLSTEFRSAFELCDCRKLKLV